MCARQERRHPTCRFESVRLPPPPPPPPPPFLPCTTTYYNVCYWLTSPHRMASEIDSHLGRTREEQKREKERKTFFFIFVFSFLAILGGEEVFSLLSFPLRRRYIIMRLVYILQGVQKKGIKQALVGWNTDLVSSFNTIVDLTLKTNSFRRRNGHIWVNCLNIVNWRTDPLYQSSTVAPSGTIGLVGQSSPFCKHWYVCVCLPFHFSSSQPTFPFFLGK